MSLPTADTLAELVRLPAVLSVPGDAWTGAASTSNRRGWAMPAASALIYLGGMALNDWADRELDAEERPERPIPSGRISPTAALAVGAGMVAGGVGVAGAIGGPAGLRIAVPLAASVWAYDVVAKDTPAGPAIMALCRALDVLLGAAGGDVTRALPAAALVGTHTLTVTTVSQHEVHGASVDVPLTALRRTAATALGLLALGLPARKEEGRAPLACAAWRPPAQPRATWRSSGAGTRPPSRPTVTRAPSASPSAPASWGSSRCSRGCSPRRARGCAPRSPPAPCPSAGTCAGSER